jgi:hypothetical protein
MSLRIFAQLFFPMNNYTNFYLSYIFLLQLVHLLPLTSSFTLTKNNRFLLN